MFQLIVKYINWLKLDECKARKFKPERQRWVKRERHRNLS